MNLPRVSKRGSLHGETMTSAPVHLLNCFAAELASTLSLRHGQGPPGRCARVICDHGVGSVWLILLPLFSADLPEVL